MAGYVFYSFIFLIVLLALSLVVGGLEFGRSWSKNGLCIHCRWLIAQDSAVTRPALNQICVMAKGGSSHS